MGNETYSKIALFKSTKSSMAEIEPLLFDLKQCIHIADERFYNLLIAVTEAFNNAIVHGNKLNPKKIVEVRLIADNSELHIIIKDEGDGFNPDMVADPREPENLLKDSGRGVFLIRTLLDGVVYDTGKHGTTIDMMFKL